MPLAILSKDIDVLGTDKYRDTNASVPALFRPTLSHNAEARNDGSSVTSTVNSIVPKTEVVNGVVTQVGTHRCTFKFFSLQNRTDEVERTLAFDNMITYLTKNKAAIISGNLPNAATTFS